jgi:hypothetical protein
MEAPVEACSLPSNASQHPSERRVHQRRRVIKGGKVIFNRGQSIIDCSIRDLSNGGARLVMPDTTIMPHDFRLQMHDGRILQCELRWARNGTFGVSFSGRLEAAPPFSEPAQETDKA